MSAVAYELPLYSYPRHLQLVPGVPNPHRRGAATYRRRRVMVAVVVTALMLSVSSLVTSGLSWAWHDLTAPAASAIAGPVTAQPQVWVVRPGDTLWGISRAIKPQGDIRPVLDKLMKAYKDRPLQVGETLPIPG